MLTQHPLVQLPPLTAAHQTQFQAMLADLIANNRVGEHDTALLTQLVADLPRLRATQPGDVRDALQLLDQNEAVLTSAFDELHDRVLHMQSALEGTHISTYQLLSSAALAALAERVHAVSQAAAEVALRAKERIDLLKRHERAS